jgi:ribosomal protein S18 acetylase RimI-like enzyme
MEESYRFIRVNSQNIRFDLLRDFYFNVCKNAFNEHELESYEDWEYVIQNQYMTFFIIIVHENKVVGGCVYEVYKKSSCSMLTYVAIDHQYRGMGLSKKLIEETVNDIKLLDIEKILIEVAVPNENLNSIARQKIWERLNFIPTDIVYTIPGRLRWKPYQVAVYKESDKIIELNKKRMENFLTEYFGQILEDETDKSEINTVQILLSQSSETIVASSDKWQK